MQCGTITLTASTVNTDNFSIYSNVDGYTTPFETGISRAALLGGYYTELIPDGANYLRIESNDVCTNYVDVLIAPLPTPTPTPYPAIVLSMGSIQVITDITDEYEAYRIVNHTPHDGSQTLSMTIDYDISAEAFLSYADVRIFWNKNGGTWTLVDEVTASSTITTSTTTGFFDITGVISSDVIRLRTHTYAYGAGFDGTNTYFDILSGTVTSGYGPVSVGSPDFWSVSFTAS